MAVTPGTRLGPYEILTPLGAGGMGEVYKAKDLKLGREVAIKVLREDLVSGPERLRRFEQEARSASSLNHPNIVHIYDIGEQDSTRFIAMEYVERKTVREVLAAGSLPTKKLLQVAAQIADGLAKAHSAGIVHRDLKPENLHGDERWVREDPGLRTRQVDARTFRSRSRPASADAVTPTSPTPRARRRSWVALGRVGAVAAFLAVATYLDVGGPKQRFSGGAPPPRIESIAVLPLDNLSGDPEQDYFADGMTEALIANLAEISALKVISRTSAMRYKGSDKPPPDIARELGVDAIIEGSALRVGDRVRITAQLIEAATDQHLWAESYERDLADMLGLQGEVSTDHCAGDPGQADKPGEQPLRQRSPG